MNSRDFVYWLQGFFEILEAGGNEKSSLCKGQIECIKKHLDYVFEHEIMAAKPLDPGAITITYGDMKDTPAPFTTVPNSDVGYLWPPSDRTIKIC